MAQQRSKADDVYATLRAEIESGALPPGASLSENQLVARLGASRTPVRDALRRLIGDDLAVRDGDRGSLRVSALSVAGVRDLFGLRSVLESAAAEQLAAGVAAGRVDPAPLVALQAELAGLAADEPSEERTTAFYALAQRFDLLVMELTPNRLLGKAIADLRPHTTRVRTVAHQRPQRDETSMTEHAAMVAALIDGDAPAAMAAVRSHLQNTLEAIFAGLADADGASCVAL